MSLGTLVSKAQTQNLYSFSAETIVGDTINLSVYYGKKLMVVNTASYCGYTSQFTQLEQLYNQYQSNDFEIIGFPCNNFGNQEPNSDSAIYEFCTSNYNVTFQMMSRIDITTGNISPIYNWLQNESENGVLNAPVTWNFHKFLIDESGNLVNHYPSQTLPNNPAIIDWILSPSVITNTLLTNNLSEVSVNYSNRSLLISGINSAKSNAIVNVFDVTGKQIATFSKIIGNNLIVELGTLKSGIYITRIQLNEQTITRKFFVEQ